MGAVDLERADGRGHAVSTIAQDVTPWQPVERKDYLTRTSFTVTTDVLMHVDVDGEVSRRTPIRVEVTAAALPITAPRRPGRR